MTIDLNTPSQNFTAPMLLINCSPRKKGTSAVFAGEISNILSSFGMKAVIVNAIDYTDGRVISEQLWPTVQRCKVIGIVTPLYYDTLPYPAIKLMEDLYRDLAIHLKDKNIFVIAQGAFPDYKLCDPIFASCRCFAEATGMRWLGGLAYPGGVLIDGKSLDNLGAKGRRIRRAFTQAMSYVVREEAIPDTIQPLLAKPVPVQLLRLLALLMNLRTKYMAWRLGVDVESRPYLP